MKHSQQLRRSAFRILAGFCISVGVISCSGQKLPKAPVAPEASKPIASVPPADCVYADAVSTYTKGLAIRSNPIKCGSGGDPSGFSIVPDLTANTGLTFNPATGEISGTASILSNSLAYVVTVLNTAGTTTADLQIGVNDAAPFGLSYLLNPASYPVGSPIVSNIPTLLGGTPLGYAVTPALPAGLSLDPATGAISGTPTVVTAAADYTIRATNTGGATSTVLNLSVRDMAPALIYVGGPFAFTKGTAIAALAPNSTGGPITSCLATPTLPAGLSLSPACVVSGTPTSISPSATYVVSATGPGGTTSVDLVVSVNDLAPSFSYSGGPFVYTRKTPIAAVAPTSTGGAITGCSATLPAGLVLSSTCVMSGTPTAVTASASYTVTATNSGGTATATIALVVNQVPALAVTPLDNIIAVNAQLTLTVVGGVPPYTFAVQGSGVGSVTALGVYSSANAGTATVRVSDSETQTMDVNFNVYVPGQTLLCSGATTNTASGGSFYDSGGPNGNYKNNEDCGLLIQPTDNVGSPISLSFSSFSLDIDHDFLKVYDGVDATGTPLHTGNGFTGATLPASVIARSGSLFVTMHTDASIVSSGFRANWHQLPANAPIAAFTASSNNVAVGQTITFTDTSTNAPSDWSWDFNSDGAAMSHVKNPTFAFTTEGKKTVTLTVSNPIGTSTTTQVIYVGMRKMCTDTASTSLTGVLFDSGGPDANYTINEDCAMLIQPTGSPGPGMITLHFNSFSTETSSHWVEVYDGIDATGVPLHPAGGFTGQNIPPDVFSISGALYVVMKTPNGHYNGDSTTHSGFEATWSSSPPGSPGALFNLSTTVASIGQPITFTDASSNSPSSWEWSFTNNGVVDSVLPSPTHGYSAAGVYTIQLRVANAFGTSSRTATVFVGSFDKMCAAGNHTTSTTAAGVGMLYDSGGPSANYTDLEDCGFVIQPAPGATSITLNFSTFDLEDTYDFLQVYDGTDATGTPLHADSGYSFGFTGQRIPPSVTATSGAMYIHFTSDQLVNRTGFSANWTSQ